MGLVGHGVTGLGRGRDGGFGGRDCMAVVGGVQELVCQLTIGRTKELLQRTTQQTEILIMAET